VDESDSRRRPAEREAFDRANTLRRERTAPGDPSVAGALRPRSTRRKSCRPPLQRAEEDAGLTRDSDEGNTVVEVLPEQCRAFFCRQRTLHDRASRLLVAVKRCSAPADEAGPVFSCAPFRTCILGNGPVCLQ
jgi:hypothetical protein